MMCDVSIRFDRAVNPHEDETWRDRGGWHDNCKEALALVTRLAEEAGWECVDPGEHDVTIEAYETAGDPAIAIYDDWAPGIEPKHAITGFVPHTSTDHIRGQLERAIDAVEGYLLLRLREQRIELTQRELRLLDVQYDRDLGVSDAEGRALLELIHIRQSRDVSELGALRAFQDLVESAGVSERELQEFFEEWPEFLTAEQLVDARPHIVLEGPTALIPDFAIQIAGDPFYDLLELKRPDARLITGGRRSQLARAASAGLAQLRFYRDALADPSVARRVNERYRLEFFKPRLHLVIGRSALADARGLRRSFDGLGPGERVTTYDQLIHLARARLGIDTAS